MTDNNEVQDSSQNSIFPDSTVKNVEKVRHYNFISLGLDDSSRVSFRRFERRFAAPAHDTVFVNAWIEKQSDITGAIERTQIAENNKDIEWENDTDAKWWIDASYLQSPTAVEVEWNWLNGSTSASSRKWSIWYKAEEFMTSYAELNDSERELANAILGKFSLLRDNHYGNSMPNISEDMQVSYSLEDIAAEMHLALQKINISALQPTSYIIGEDSGSHFPTLFYNYLMIETLVGLIRKIAYGYLETPDIQGNTGVAYADRRSYYQKWKDEQRNLEADAQALKDAYNRATLNFTASSVLVAGGMFGGGTGNGFLTNKMAAAIERGWAINGYFPLNTAAPIVVNPNA